MLKEKYFKYLSELGGYKMSWTIKRKNEN